MQTVHLYGKEAIRNGVPKAFLGTPFLINERGDIESTISEYLLARRNGDFDSHTGAGVLSELAGFRAFRCENSYLHNRAYQLDIVRKWCVKRKINPCKITARQLERFATWYEKGGHKKTGPLKPSTVNQVLDTTIDFLQYSVITKQRTDLGIPFRAIAVTRRSTRDAWNSYLTRQVKHYIVKRREHPREIVEWCSEEEIRRFIGEIDNSHIRLAVEIIYECGLRLSEVIATSVTTFPTAAEWKRSPSKRFISVTGKGKKTRRIEIPLKLVKAIEGFISIQRKRNLISSGLKTSVLLVGPKRKLTRRMLQRAIKSVSLATGMVHLSPHMIRHHYAAHFLLRAWVRKRSGREFDPNVGTHLLSHELIRLKQNLGHASITTTFQYLYGLAYLVGGEYAEAFQRELESNG